MGSKLCLVHEKIEQVDQKQDFWKMLSTSILGKVLILVGLTI